MNTNDFKERIQNLVDDYKERLSQSPTGDSHAYGKFRNEEQHILLDKIEMEVGIFQKEYGLDAYLYNQLIEISRGVIEASGIKLTIAVK